MKGVSTILSHMSYLAIGLIALSLIVASVYMWGEKTEEIFLHRQLRTVSSSILNDIIELKMISDKSNVVGDRIIAELGSEMPDKISNENYQVDFLSNRITVSAKTSKGNRIEESVILTFDIADSSAVSPFLIRLERVGNIDRIYLVD